MRSFKVKTWLHCDELCPEGDLRFKLGDRVLANVEGKNTVWRVGTVTQLHYREDDWAENKVAPYQIRIDSDCGLEHYFVYAPADVDELVRPFSGTPEELALVEKNKEIPVDKKSLRREGHLDKSSDLM